MTQEEADRDEGEGVDQGDEFDELVVDAEVPDPLHEAYMSLMRKVDALPEVPMQAAAVAQVMSGLDAEEKVWCIDQILRAALWGHRGALETVTAMVWWLIQMRIDDEYDEIKTLFLTSHEAGRPSVTDLVREVPPYQALPKGKRLPEVRLPLDRDVTLGERRVMASGPERRYLERLLMDPNALVIRKLLDNPQIRMEDISVIATRRPTMPILLQEIVVHPRWFRRYGAREAVLRNPFADTGLALKLLPTMRLKTLRQLVYSGDLHPLIQESAKRLVKLREERTAPWRV